MEGSKEKEISSDQISWLGKRSIKIRQLISSNVTYKTARQIADISSGLNWLSIRDKKMVDRCLCKIIDNCPNVLYFNINSCNKVTNKSIKIYFSEEAY